MEYSGYDKVLYLRHSELTTTNTYNQAAALSCQSVHTHTCPMAPLISVLLLATASAARDITFPPKYQSPLAIHGAELPTYADIDVSSANFAGLTTFANLPYFHCLSKDPAEGEYDIAILGAPFDTVCIIPNRLVEDHVHRDNLDCNIALPINERFLRLYKLCTRLLSLVC